jgi:hypothetical protein
MELRNFRLDEITDANLRTQLNSKLADGEFVPTSPRVWIADFVADGVRYQAAIRLGHRAEIASDIEQVDVQLRIRDEDFDADTFLSMWKIAQVTKAVGDEFQKIYRPN